MGSSFVNVTPYIHAMAKHVSEFRQIHGSVLPFTQQGLEKYNILEILATRTRKPFAKSWKSRTELSICVIVMERSLSASRQSALTAIN